MFDNNITIVSQHLANFSIVNPRQSLYLHKHIDMNFIVYLIAYPILWIISILPYRIFYLLSDFLYILIYHIVGYRKKVVRENITMTMPELSSQRVKEIEKRFYRHLCDIFLEMAKAMTISEEEQKKRYLITNPELLQQASQQNRSILFFCSHYANWEWMNILGKYTDYHGYAVYKQIKNPYFDRLFKNTRSRFGATLIEMRETIRVIRANELLGNKDFYAFISDQSPMVHKSNYWHEFMGIEVPVFTGAEAIGKKFNMVPLFLKVKYVKRGYYSATFFPLLDIEKDSKDLPNYQLTDRFLEEVEKQIKEAPEFYFWTHKRWKHQGTKPKSL